MGPQQWQTSQQWQNLVHIQALCQPWALSISLATRISLSRTLPVSLDVTCGMRGLKHLSLLRVLCTLDVCLHAGFYWWYLLWPLLSEERQCKLTSIGPECVLVLILTCSMRDCDQISSKPPGLWYQPSFCCILGLELSYSVRITFMLLLHTHAETCFSMDSHVAYNKILITHSQQL